QDTLLNLAGHNWTMTGAKFSNGGSVRLYGYETITGLVNDTTSGIWIYVDNGDGVSDTRTIKDFGAVDYNQLAFEITTGSTETFQATSALNVAQGFYPLD